MGAYLSSPITAKETHEGESSDFVYGIAAMQGWRTEMEDAHAVSLRVPIKPSAPLSDGGGGKKGAEMTKKASADGGDDDGEKREEPGSCDDDSVATAFFGVFDGHGGKEVAKFVAAHIVEEVAAAPALEEARKRNDGADPSTEATSAIAPLPQSGPLPDASSKPARLLASALESAYFSTDARVCSPAARGELAALADSSGGRGGRGGSLDDDEDDVEEIEGLGGGGSAPRAGTALSLLLGGGGGPAGGAGRSRSARGADEGGGGAVGGLSPAMIAALAEAGIQVRVARARRSRLEIDDEEEEEEGDEDDEEEEGEDDEEGDDEEGEEEESSSGSENEDKEDDGDKKKKKRKGKAAAAAAASSAQRPPHSHRTHHRHTTVDLVEEETEEVTLSSTGGGGSGNPPAAAKRKRPAASAAALPSPSKDEPGVRSPPSSGDDKADAKGEEQGAVAKAEEDEGEEVEEMERDGDDDDEGDDGEGAPLGRPGPAGLVDLFGGAGGRGRPPRLPDDAPTTEYDPSLGGRYVGPSAGCTAVSALVRGDQLAVANAGDSRAVLCRAGGVALALTRDHKPTEEPELGRILGAGGFVSDGRVNGSLNLSRALGDAEHKLSPGLDPRDQAVTCAPDLSTVTLVPGDEFLLLACDGIWDVLTCQEAVDFVRERLSSDEMSPAEAASALCDRCLAPDTGGCGKGCDNMSAMVVVLKRFAPRDVVERAERATAARTAARSARVQASPSKLESPKKKKGR